MLERTRKFNEGLNDRFFRRGGYLRWYKRLVVTLSPDEAVVLHLGAGCGTTEGYLDLFHNKEKHFGRIIAVDIDVAELRRNRRELRIQGDAEALPIKNGAVDVVACEHVLEHLEDPMTAMAECYRVLGSGGRLIFAAPNKWSYISLVAKYTPKPVHVWISKLRGFPLEKAQPTYYRLNTIRSIGEAATASGFVVQEIRTFVGEPNYTVFLPGFHIAFIVLHKLLSTFDSLQVFGIDIVGALLKRVVDTETSEVRSDCGHTGPRGPGA